MNTKRDLELIIENHYLAVRRHVYREGSAPNPDIKKIATEAAERVRVGEQKLKKLRLPVGERYHFSRLRKGFELLAKSLEIAAKGTNNAKAAELSKEADGMMSLYAITVLGKAVRDIESRNIS
ncbi:hypothetical protein JOC54_001613 [Alkalihalobacillus xiaoxiensis]|uniref:Uncharacterized protein n=1 Tax=Shouchella xiaoxiensis TaxID=766895 RepID=A0ABS2SS85_9BACI|nr:hypothetical protein [Shouchella xiaoxiensis]MBM7838357.1 hypothetical protein [Shouchella xiaoxiensis]